MKSSEFMIPIRKPLATMAGIIGTKMSPSSLIALRNIFCCLAAASFASAFVLAVMPAIVEYFIYCSRSEDDLKLAGRLKHALYSLHILYGRLVCLAVIGNNETKSCCTVCGGYNILAAAHFIKDFLCGISVIHDNPPSLCVIDFISFI